MQNTNFKIILNKLLIYILYNKFSKYSFILKQKIIYIFISLFKFKISSAQLYIKFLILLSNFLNSSS